MNRRAVLIKLTDGKEYKFSERNREDKSLDIYEERLREQRIKFIQRNVLNEDVQLPLMLAEMNKIYTTEQLGRFLSGNKDALKQIAYDSFKIANPDIKYEAFAELLPDDMIKHVNTLISELENE